MTGETWETDKDGNIIVFPLVSFQIELFHGAGIAVQLRTADRSLEAGSPIYAMQLALLPDHALALADALVMAAGRAQTRPSDPSQVN